jgi:deoxyribodipyrimidine photolyase-related protein
VVAPVLVTLLGHQLSPANASLRGCAKDQSVILVMEVWGEATYAR